MRLRRFDVRRRAALRLELRKPRLTSRLARSLWIRDGLNHVHQLSEALLGLAPRKPFAAAGKANATQLALRESAVSGHPAAVEGAVLRVRRIAPHEAASLPAHSTPTRRSTRTIARRCRRCAAISSRPRQDRRRDVATDRRPT